MKIFCDVQLSLATLQGFEKENLKLAKFGVKLHKSILKFENSDFSLALSMFPNKLRFENFNCRPLEFFGERKIVSLMKDDVIKEFKDFKKGVNNYKQLKVQITKHVHGMKKRDKKIS